MVVVPDNTAEIFRQIKFHFNSEDALAALSLSRRPRCKSKPKHHSPTLEKLAEDRERRKELDKCGLFSAAWQPYRPVGSVSLDMKELIYSKLGIESDVAKTLNARNRSLFRVKARASLVPLKMTESDQSDSGNTTKDARAWESQCQSTRLRSWLDESERRMLATKAGRTWTECARESEKQLKLEKDRNLVSGGVGSSGGTCGSAEWRQQRPPHPKLRALFLLSRLGVLSSRRDEQYEMDLATSAERAKAVKRQEEFAVKLQTIYMIVCCVSNMKQRDLRTKIPLNSDILKILQKDVSLEGDCQISQRKSFAPQIAVIDSMAAVLDVSVAATSDQEVENSKTSQLPRERLFSGFGGRFLRNRARSGVRPSVMNRHGSRIRFDQSTKQSKIETWDDLVASLERDTRRQRIPSAKPRSSAMLRSWIFSGNRDSVANVKRSQENSTLPQWQKLMLPPTEEEDDHEETPPRKRDNSTEGETSAEEQLRKLKEKFDRAIEKSERQLQAQLDSYKRDSNELYSFKFEKLKDGPTWNVATGVASVQEARIELQSRRKRREECANKAVTWTGMLEKELESTFLEPTGKGKESVLRKASSRTVLEKLKTIAQNQLANIPHVKPKLCLLLHSLPPIKVCSKAVSDAFQFSLEHLFGCSPSLYEEWMKNRKLPFPLPVKND